MTPASGSYILRMSWIMVDLPQPDSPKTTLLRISNWKLTFLRTNLLLFEGYAKLTSMNLITPLKSGSVIPSYASKRMAGSRSTTAKTLARAYLPWSRLEMVGVTTTTR